MAKPRASTTRWTARRAANSGLSRHCSGRPRGGASSHAPPGGGGWARRLGARCRVPRTPRFGGRQPADLLGLAGARELLKLPRAKAESEVTGRPACGGKSRQEGGRRVREGDEVWMERQERRAWRGPRDGRMTGAVRPMNAPLRWALVVVVLLAALGDGRPAPPPRSRPAPAGSANGTRAGRARR